MSVECDQFESILQQKQLESIITNRDFILAFLDQLYTKLKEIPTSNQCYDLYPRIGPLLTKAAIHPYIGHDSAITKLVLSCLLEYAKLDLDPTSSNATIPKSHLWCIIRLRRLISVGKETATTADVDTLVAKISQLLDNQYNNPVVLNNKIIHACLGLMHDDKAFPVIEKLIDLALPQQQDIVVDLINFDPPQRLLSNQFLSHLARNDSLHKHAVAYWSTDLRARLLLNYTELLESELLDLIASYTTHSDYYESICTMQQQLSQHALVKLAITSAALSELLIAKLASYVVLLLDFRVVRIMQSVYGILESTASCRIFSEFKPNHKWLSNYMYSASLDAIQTKRNIVWCLSLASIRSLWPLVDTLVNWSQTSDLWNSQIQDSLVYINWIICPTGDNRESQSYTDLESWIQSSRGKGLFHNLASLWRKLFNSNAVILSLFIISILTRLHVDQQISLIESIYFVPGVAREDDDSTSTDCKANIYILLDSLQELNALIPAITINIPHLVNHIQVCLN